MRSLTIPEVLTAVRGRLVHPMWPSGPIISAVCSDTRSLKPGALFIAIKGEHFDGHRFLDEAAASGAVAAMVQDEPATVPAGLTVIVVDDTRKAMGRLATYVRSTLRARVIAVAGSNGKTGTKHLVDAALCRSMLGSISPHSFNNDIGVPITIFAAQESHDYLVLEIGTNHPGEIIHLATMARPDIAVITNCSAEHLEFLGNLDGVRAENACIMHGLGPDGTLIVNGDDAALVAAVIGYRGEIIRFGFDPSNDVFATDVECDESGVRFKLDGHLPVSIPLLGHHNAANALAAIAVARRLRLSYEPILAGLATAKKPDMRLQLSDVNGVTLLNDAYNANPASMKAALETLQTLPTKGRRIAVVGDMKELGESSDQLHEEMGAFAAKSGIDTLVCVGKQAALIAGVARRVGMAQDRVQIFPDAQSAAAAFPAGLDIGDVVLLKASRGMHLEVVAEAIKNCRKSVL